MNMSDSAPHKRRAVSWFSCGAASAVATKLALESNALRSQVDEVVIAYCEIKQEHPDNMRFLRDCERWFGQKIHILGNDEYGRDTDRVFRETRFLVGPKGARCTGELKRSVRWEFQRPDDIVIIGFTQEENKKRGNQLRKAEPLTDFYFPLVEFNYTKQMCIDTIQQAGIQIPMMYRLGYNNNNCIGCVKGQAGYWNKIRRDFPDRFAEMARIERDLGRQICKREWVENGQRKLERVWLDEMPPDLGRYSQEVDIECGILCASTEMETGMKIYVASHSRELAQKMADDLADQGYTITSRWHGKEFHPTEHHTVNERRAIAQEDYDDICAADALVLIAGEEKYSGGKFVEAGIAIGQGKPVYVYGRRENMLMWLPAVNDFSEIAA